MPKDVNKSESTMAFEAAPMIIHGLYLPIFVLVLSTIVPIIGSLTPSQILASGVKISKNASLRPSTLER